MYFLFEKSIAPIGKKLQSGLKLASFYSKWYPTQWINPSLFGTDKKLGKLSNHISYIEKGAHKLARTIFHYMGIYQNRLERKQNVLGKLMEIGTLYFAMATTCSYASSQKKALTNREGIDENTPEYLADVF